MTKNEQLNEIIKLGEANKLNVVSDGNYGWRVLPDNLAYAVDTYPSRTIANGWHTNTLTSNRYDNSLLIEGNYLDTYELKSHTAISYATLLRESVEKDIDSITNSLVDKTKSESYIAVNSHKKSMDKDINDNFSNLQLNSKKKPAVDFLLLRDDLQKLVDNANEHEKILLSQMENLLKNFYRLQYSKKLLDKSLEYLERKDIHTCKLFVSYSQFKQLCDSTGYISLLNEELSFNAKYKEARALEIEDAYRDIDEKIVEYLHRYLDEKKNLRTCNYTHIFNVFNFFCDVLEKRHKTDTLKSVLDKESMDKLYNIFLKSIDYGNSMTTNKIYMNMQQIRDFLLKCPYLYERINTLLQAAKQLDEIRRSNGNDPISYNQAVNNSLYVSSDKSSIYAANNSNCKTSEKVSPSPSLWLY